MIGIFTMVIELYTYVETVSPSTMVHFLSAATTMYPDSYYTDDNIIRFHNTGKGYIKISNEEVAAKIVGIGLFRLLEKIPEFYSMLRGTTIANDLKDD